MAHAAYGYYPEFMLGVSEPRHGSNLSVIDVSANVLGTRKSAKNKSSFIVFVELLILNRYQYELWVLTLNKANESLLSSDN